MFKKIIVLLSSIAFMLSSTAMVTASDVSNYDPLVTFAEVLEGLQIDTSYTILFMDDMEAQKLLEHYKLLMSDSTQRNIFPNLLSVSVSRISTRKVSVTFRNIAIDRLDSVTGNVWLYDGRGEVLSRTGVNERSISAMGSRTVEAYSAQRDFSGGSIDLVIRDGSASLPGTMFF